MIDGTTEDRYRALFEVIPQDVVVYDTEGVMIEANQAAAEIIGADLDELIGHNTRGADWQAWTEDGEDLPWDGRPLAITLRTGEPVRDYVFGINRVCDGDRRWIRASTEAIFGDDGDVAAAVACITDITEQRTEQRQLQESREHLQAIIDASPPGIITVNMEGIVTSWSPSAERIFGWSADEVIGEFNPTVSEEMREFYLNSIREWDHRGTGESEEVAVLSKDGSTTEIAISVAPLYEDGEQVGVVGIMEDISARREAERREVEQRRRLEAILDSSPFAIITLDPDGIVTSWNPAAEELFGWTEEETIGQVHPAIRSDDRERFNRTIDAVATDGEPLTRESEVMRSDGSHFLVQVSVAPLRDADGEIYGLVGIHQDITERKEAEERLRESRSRYRSLFEHSPVAVWEMDFSGVMSLLDTVSATTVQQYSETFERRPDLLTECLRGIDMIDLNEAVLAMHNARAREELLERYTEVVPEDGAEVIGEGLALLMTGWTIFDLTVPLRTLDGDDLEVLMRVQVMPHHEDTLERVVVSALDISEVEQARQDLKEANQLLEATLSSMDQAVMVFDSHRRVVSSNQAAAEMFGVTVADLEGDTLREFHPSADGWEHYGRRVKSTLVDGDSHHEELTLVRSDGGEFLAEVTTSPLNPAEGWLGGAVSVARDVTDDREMQERLEQSQRMEAVGKLAGGIAHDFNNMLTVIVGNLGMALPRLDGGSQLHEQVAHSLEAARRTAKLTDQLLSFSRKQTLSPEAVELNETVRELERLLTRTIPESIGLKLSLDARASVFFDPAQIDQIVMNLVMNARDAMPEGGTLTIATRDVHVGEDDPRPPGMQPGDYVRLCVCDTGVGMENDTAQHIFEPFFSTKDDADNTGLGLSTVYGILQQGGGGIEVESTPGEGTRFDVYLPVTEDGASAPESRSATSPLPATGETILVAEDDAAVRRLVVSVLQSQGYDVLAGCSGPEARRLFDDNDGAVDLLVTDVVMPGMSGAQLARHLREVRQGLPVLFISGYTGDVLDDHGLGDGSARLLYKPFTPDELLREVKQILKGRAGG